MKEKKYIKTNIIGFVVGGLLISGFAVYAAVTFPSKDVTYDNVTSELQSTDAQGAIDELYTECTKVPTAGEQIIEDNELEKDPYECRYFFTGANPNNYVTFNNEKAGWRIISVECDGTIKIMRNTSIGSMEWDSNKSNNWNNASLKTYLNGTYYNRLNSTAQSQITLHDWGIGAVTYSNNDLAAQINSENSTTWNGKVALVTASEYLRTNLNTNCKTFYSYASNFYNTCRHSTWMYTDAYSDWWVLSPHESVETHWIIALMQDGAFTSIASWGSIAVRPAIYLSSSVQITGGDGSQSNPYTIE